MPTEQQPSTRNPFAALEFANYRLFLSGFLFSSLGLQMLNAGIAWEIAHRTRDPYAVGLAGLARALPVVLMALPAGWAVDHFDRRKVLSLTQISFAAMAGLLAYESFAHASLWSMYALLFCMGCVRSFNGPSRSSLLPDLVPGPTFSNAVTWTTGVFHFSAATGPILAAVVMKCSGHTPPEYALTAIGPVPGVMTVTSAIIWPTYVFTSIGCLVLGITALFMKPTPVVNKPSKRGPMRLSDMLAGASHVWREKAILATITLDLFAVLLGGVSALLPFYCQDILHVDELGYGLLRAAMPIGATLMAIVLAHMPPMRRAGNMLLLSVAGYGVCTVVFGFSELFWLSLLMLLFAGALDSVSVVIRHVLVQTRTPASLRGRVSAVNSVFIESSNELGSYESGLVAKFFGPVASAVSGGFGTMLVVLGVAWAIPSLRKLDRLEEPRTEDAISQVGAEEAAREGELTGVEGSGGDAANGREGERKKA